MKSFNKPQKQHIWQDSIETGGNQVGKQLSSLSKDTIRSMWEDFFKASAKKNLPEQVLNTKQESASKPKSEGFLSEGQEMTLSAHAVTETKRETREYMEYVRQDVLRAEVKNETNSEYESREQVEMIKIEIKKLIKAQKEMEVSFKEVSQQVTVETTPQEGGVYYENFFAWVLLTLRNARMRVEEGKTWMALFASKKGQQQYWNQAKKKGTSFTQHHDRAVATQTG